VIPSLTGDGMTMALASGRAAARAITAVWQGGTDADNDIRRAQRLDEATSSYHTEAVRVFRRQMRVAVGVQQVFAHPRVLDVLLRAGRWVPSVVPLLVQATRVPERLRAEPRR
jgi:flavin-dependent dehydrogenase